MNRCSLKPALTEAAAAESKHAAVRPSTQSPIPHRTSPPIAASVQNGQTVMEIILAAGMTVGVQADLPEWQTP